MIPAYNPPPRPEIEHGLSAGERLANLSRDKVDNVCDAQVVLLREKKLVAFIYKTERMHVTRLKLSYDLFTRPADTESSLEDVAGRTSTAIASATARKNSYWEDSPS